MAGRGPAPKTTRRRANAPVRGDYKPTAGVGWQHGPVPDAPEGLMPATVIAWQTWMSSWVAAHWSPLDLPGLRQLIRLYDQVERGEFVRATELRLGMDTFGISPKGQQDRRWTPPEDDAADERTTAPTAPSRYAHLRIAQ